MLKKHNSKQFLAGMGLTAVLAFALAAARPSQVAASSAVQPAAASMLTTLEIAAGQVFHGTAQLASDMRSLYSVYQLQSAPEASRAIALQADANPLAHEGASLIVCEILQPPPPPKKKCRA